MIGQIRVSLILVSLAIFSVLPAVGQDSVPLGKPRLGVVDLHPKPENCTQYIAKAQATLALISEAPKGHRWIVACSLESWNAALKKSRGWGRTNAAFTMEGSDLTVINGAVFEEQQAYYQHLMAHEVGHMLCRCSSESKAEAEAAQILKEANRTSTAGEK